MRWWNRATCRRSDPLLRISSCLASNVGRLELLKRELSKFRRSSFQAGEKLRNGHFEVLRNRQYAHDGQVPLASFNTAHVRSVEATDIRKLLLGPSSLGSKLTNALAQRLLHGFVFSFRFSFSHLQSVSKDAIQNVYRSLLDRQHIAYPQMAISVSDLGLEVGPNGISRRRREMNPFEADYVDGLEARPSSDTPAVLLEGSVPRQFLYPPKAIASDCTAVTAVASILDSCGVDYLRDLLSRDQPPDVRLVLLVHATCPTTQQDLFDLLALLDTNRLKVWVLAVKEWGQRCMWGLCVRRESPAHVLWTSTASDFGLLRPAVDEAHLVTAADPLVVDQFISWFSRLAATAAPLTPETARIPALVPAEGTQAAAEMWNRYAACCRAVASAASGPAFDSPTSTVPPQAVSEQAAKAVEMEIRKELKIPKSDPLLPQLVQLFENGDLVMIDKGSRLPPLEVPIKAEWFGIPSFREVGVVSREVRYKISVLDERTNKALDARRKGTSELREKFSFPLAEGSRWMPHRAKPLFQAELKRLDEEGRKLLGSIVSGTPAEWVQSKRDLVTRDANRQYEEFHPGKRMPEETINEILKALTDRFQQATSANFLPKVSFVKTSFRLGGDSEHVSEWAAARTLLRAIAQYPRSALKDRAYFFRGLQVSEEDLLTGMNVVEDPLVTEWFRPRSLRTARLELEIGRA